jgi:hypothetical protein
MLDVEVLLQRADIGAVLTRLGIEYENRNSKRGHELYFCCPTNRHPSDPLKKRCSIANDGKYKGMFNCWACDFHGNLTHLIRFVTGWTFVQALQFLEKDYGSADVAGIDALNFRLKMNKSSEDRLELPVFDLPDDYKLLTKCSGFDARRAFDWLVTERNITPDGMDKYEIGFCYHEKIGATIVMPVRFMGKIHSIFWAQPFKGGIKRYPKDSPQGDIMFNFDTCLAARSYIMMESILDVVKYDCVIGGQAMACFTNMISSRQLELLRLFDEHGVMPDLDGARGWDLVTRMLPIVGKSLWLYFCPLGKDPGDCTPSELAQATSERIRYCDYEFAQWVVQKQHIPHKILGIRKT